MSMAIILKLLSSAWKGTLEFLRKYWMQIIGIAICLGLIWAGYTWGFNVADNKWIVANNKQVGDLNEKIGRLEKTASESAGKAQVEKEKLEKRLEELLAATPDTVNHDQSGNVLKCDNKPVPVYLGTDFQRAWNKINAESNK